MARSPARRLRRFSHHIRKPVTAKTSKILYTLMYDVSDKPDQAAKDADIARRRTAFENALKNMKALAEK